MLGALDEVRPYLESHGGNVQFLGIEGDVARVRLEGSCDGCPSSTMTLKLAIEEAVQKAAPELEGVEAEGVVEPPPKPATTIVAGPTLSRRKKKQPEEDGASSWTAVDGLDLSDGRMLAKEVVGEPVLFLKLAGSLYAYRDAVSWLRRFAGTGRVEGRGSHVLRLRAALRRAPGRKVSGGLAAAPGARPAARRRRRLGEGGRAERGGLKVRMAGRRQLLCLLRAAPVRPGGDRQKGDCRGRRPGGMVRAVRSGHTAGSRAPAHSGGCDARDPLRLSAVRHPL